MDASDLNTAELEKYIEEQKASAMVAQMISKITSVCWDKCVTSTPAGKFSSAESNCLSNCGRRYADMVLAIDGSVKSHAGPGGGFDN